MDEESIYDYIVNYGNSFLKTNFLGIFAANEFNKYAAMIQIQKNISNPIAIFNTKSRIFGGEHWIAIVLTDENNLIVFDSFGKKGFKNFFITDDIQKFSKFAKIESENGLTQNNLIDLLSIEVNKRKYVKNRRDLSKLCQSFFNYCLSLNMDQDSFKIEYLFDQIQEETNNYCGAYVVYFLNEISNLKYINKNSVTKILSKKFYDLEKNEANKNLTLNTKLIENFIKKYNLKIDESF